MIDQTNALQFARDAFSGSTSHFDANVRPELERDIRQFQSKHPTSSKYLSDGYRGRSKFFRPKTRAMVRSAEASVAEAFFSTSGVVSIEAPDETDDVSQASAEIMQELLQYRLSGSDVHSILWYQTVLGAFQDAEVQGVVISHQEWDKAKDKPSVDLIPRENFRFDPAANWIDPINTSPYCIWLKPMYVKDVKSRMTAGKWIPLNDSEILSASRKYSDSTKTLREGDRASSSDAVTSINAFSIVWVHLNVMADDSGQDVMFYTLGTEFLLSNPEPLTIQYAHGRRPFVMGKAVIETHRVDPAGDVRLTRDTQAEINEIANQRIDNVKFAMNKRFFVRRNRQVDVRALTRSVAGGITLMTNPDEDVKVLETNDVTGSSYQEQDRLNMDFDEISGNMSQSSVAANRRLNETVGGMEILSADANKVRAYGIKTFIETWAEPVLRQLVLLEQAYETDVVILALAAGKSKMFQQLGMDAITDDLLNRELTLSVSVGMNATSPTQKINNLLTGINGVKTALADGVLAQHGVDSTEIIKEIFGALGHKDGGRFFKFDGEGDPRVAQLEQQIQQLTQQLEAKNPPELVAAMVDEIRARIGKIDAEKVAKGVEATYSSMQSAEVIAQMPQVAPIADELMKAAGYQSPNPVGVDPNFPMAQAGAVAEQVGPVDIPESGNTSPMFPARTGMNEGIEAAGYANGGLIDSIIDYADRVGPTWSESNAQFEQTDPKFIDRVGRAINPLTGFGSALGAMHDAAGNGDITGMGVATLQAMPLLAPVNIAKAIPAAGVVKAGQVMNPSVPATVAAVLGGGAVGAAADTYDKDKNKKQ